MNFAVVPLGGISVSRLIRGNDADSLTVTHFAQYISLIIEWDITVWIVPLLWWLLENDSSCRNLPQPDDRHHARGIEH